MYSTTKFVKATMENKSMGGYQECYMSSNFRRGVQRYRLT